MAWIQSFSAYYTLYVRICICICTEKNKIKSILSYFNATLILLYFLRPVSKTCKQMCLSEIRLLETKTCKWQEITCFLSIIRLPILYLQVYLTTLSNQWTNRQTERQTGITQRQTRGPQTFTVRLTAYMIVNNLIFYRFA